LENEFRLTGGLVFFVVISLKAVKPYIQKNMLVECGFDRRADEVQ